MIFPEKTYHKVFPVPAGKTFVFFALLLAGGLVYAPVFTKSLASDDYQSVYRVATTGHLFPEGFFRPLSDFSLWLNFKCWGYHSPGYNVFNFLLHVTCCFLIYLYTLKASWLPRDGGSELAWMTSLFFLVYSFHSEAINWCVGRGASLATLFALLSLMALEIKRYESWGMVWAAAAYFAGLLAYESIIILPAILIPVFWWKSGRLNKSLLLVVALAAALAVHLWLRVYASGGFLGAYASGMDEIPAYVLGLNFLKSAGRLFLPPAMHSPVLLAGALVLAAVLAAAVRFNLSQGFGRLMTRLGMFTVIALIPPAFFSVSTQTTESDRLLYFPSFFVCLFLAHTVILSVRRFRFGFWMIPLLAVYFLAFTEITNFRWKRSSEMQDQILNDIRTVRNKVKGNFLLLNIPDEFAGAYMFRNGFPEALLIHGIDTMGLKRLTRFSRNDFENAPEIITPEMKADSFFLYPGLLISPSSGSGEYRIISNGRIIADHCRLNEIWYWNRKKLVQFSSVAGLTH